MWWRFVLQDVTLGFAVGIGMGLLAASLLPRSRRSRAPAVAVRARRRVRDLRRRPSLPPRRQRADRGLRVRDHARHPPPRAAARRSRTGADDIVEIVKLGIFVVFGALLTFDGLFGDGWAAVGVVAITLLVARPVAIAVALLGTQAAVLSAGVHGLVRPQGRGDDDLLTARARRGLPGERIFNLAALCVFVSILAHGLTDAPGSELDR